MKEEAAVMRELDKLAEEEEEMKEPFPFLLLRGFRGGAAGREGGKGGRGRQVSECAMAGEKVAHVMPQDLKFVFPTILNRERRGRARRY